jgi:hypothetical protein
MMLRRVMVVLEVVMKLFLGMIVEGVMVALVRLEGMEAM